MGTLANLAENGIASRPLASSKERSIRSALKAVGGDFFVSTALLSLRTWIKGVESLVKECIS